MDDDDPWNDIVSEQEANEWIEEMEDFNRELMIREDLKPCPFCDGAAQLIHEDIWHWVQCSNPECYTMPWKDLGVSGAVEVWNTRPIEDELRAEIERLKAELKKHRGIYGSIRLDESLEDILKDQHE